MPRHPESGSDPGHREVIDHDRRQRPPQPATGELRPVRRGPPGGFSPGMSAVIAPVSPEPDQQRRRAMPERFVGQTTSKRSPRPRLRTAAMTPRIRVRQPALDHRPVGLESLPDHGQAEFVETAERRQVSRREGSVGHVEVFRTVSVRTSILEDLDPVHPDRPAPLTPPPLPPQLRRAARGCPPGSLAVSRSHPLAAPTMEQRIGRALTSSHLTAVPPHHAAQKLSQPRRIIRPSPPTARAADIPRRRPQSPARD